MDDIYIAEFNDYDGYKNVCLFWDLSAARKWLESQYDSGGYGGCIQKLGDRLPNGVVTLVDVEEKEGTIDD